MITLLAPLISCNEKTISGGHPEIAWTNSNINLHRGTSANPSLTISLCINNNSDDSFNVILKDSQMSYFESNLYLVFQNPIKNNFDTLSLANNTALNTLSVPPNSIDSVSAYTIFVKGATYNQIDSNSIRIANNATLLLKNKGQFLIIRKSKDYTITHDTGYINIKE